MAIYGVDIHPQFQAGIDIEQIRAEGFDFMACKLSEGRGAYDSLDWLRRGRACGLICLGYHYLRPGDEPAQAGVFATQLARAGVPGMLDAEALAGDGKIATLTVAGIRRFLAEATARGARVPLLYLPRWYWQRMGSPDLSGLPALWASGYVGGTGHATELYESVTPSRWADYGGGRVEVLQFTDRGQVAGHEIDCNHYRGTRAQLAALIGGSATPLPREEDDMQNIPITGTGRTVLVCPVGDKAASHRDAWLSAAVWDLTGEGWIQVYAQGDDAGVHDWRWTQAELGANPEHVLRRPYMQLRNGVTKLVVSWDITAAAGGVLCLETRPAA